MRFPAPIASVLRERAVCIGVAATGLVLVVANAFGKSLWICVFHEATGLPCPGCGLTRGLTAFARGDVQQALHWHPFTPVFAFGAVLTLVVTVLPAPQRVKVLDVIARIEARTGITFVLLIALFAFGLWRMTQGPGDF